MTDLSLSLVMPALNAGEHIEEALESVARQLDGASDLEVVLADGGSSDQTREIARGYSFVRVLEGGDNGIYDGFNRGLAASRGDIVGFLNADDCLGSDAVNLIAKAFANEATQFVSGAATWSKDCTPDGLATAVVRRNEDPLNIEGLLFGIPAINSRFFRRSLIEKTGLLNTEAGLAADREFLLRVFKTGAKGINIDQKLYHYRVHAGSTTIAGDKATRTRVWRAECQLAEHLLAGDVLRDTEMKWVRRSRALSRLKQVIGGDYRLATALLRDAGHLPAALKAWQGWRASLSGY